MPKSPEGVTADVASPQVASARVKTPRAMWLLGPALVAGVAYLDPGNVASNMTAGAQYGYLLVWILVVVDVIA